LIFWWAILSVWRQGLIERVAFEVGVDSRQGQGVVDRGGLRFQRRVHDSMVESSVGRRCVSWEIVGAELGDRSPVGPGSEGGWQSVGRVGWEAVGVKGLGRSERQREMEFNEVLEFILVHQAHHGPHVDGPAQE